MRLRACHLARVGDHCETHRPDTDTDFDLIHNCEKAADFRKQPATGVRCVAKEPLLHDPYRPIF